MKNAWPLSALAALLTVACTSGTATAAGNAQEPAAPPSAAEATTATTEAESAEDTSPASQYAEDPVAQKRGSDLFRALCTGYCHSTNAGEDTDASYLFDCEWSHVEETDQGIFDVIYEGIPETRMQGFGGKLPDEDLWKIVSFLRVQAEC